MKLSLAFFLITSLSFGIVQPINNTPSKTKNDKTEIYKHKENFFENGLLPLPDGKPIAVEPLPLPKDPPPLPEQMPYSHKDKHNEKEKSLDENQEQEDK